MADYFTALYHLERVLAVPDDMIVTIVVEMKGKKNYELFVVQLMLPHCHLNKHAVCCNITDRDLFVSGDIKP
jgi:hypothetical protein